MALSQLETLLPPLVIVVTGAAQATVRAGVTYSTTGEVTADASVPHSTTGAGCTCFTTTVGNFQDGCRDGHQDVRILQAEAL